MSSLAAVFAKNVRNRRLCLHLTQIEVAARAGLSVSYISYLEANRRAPAFETIEKIAEALCLPPEALFERPNSTRRGAA